MAISSLIYLLKMVIFHSELLAYRGYFPFTTLCLHCKLGTSTLAGSIKFDHHISVAKLYTETWGALPYNVGQ